MKNYYLLYFALFFSIGFIQAQEKKRILVSKLSNAINSEYEELAPVISGNGRVLYFVRYEDKGKGRQDIWRSIRQDEQADWQKAERLPEPINNEQHNVVCGTNEDGSLLFLSNAYDSTKLTNRYDGWSPGVSVSKFENNSWSPPKEIKFVKPTLKERGLAQSGHFYFHYYKDLISKQAFILVSLHDLKKTQLEKYRDEEDIFVFKYDSVQSSCELICELGENINTGVYETAPFLSKDGKTLYFTQHCNDCHNEPELYSTDAHIMVSKMKSRSADINTPAYWQNWDKPKDINSYFEATKENGEKGGESLNSEHFDAYMTFHDLKNETDFDYAFFSSARKTSTRGEKTKDDEVRADIYQVKVLPNIYTLIIKTLDCETNKPIATTIRLIPPQTETLEKSNNSSYEFTFVGDDKVKGQFKIAVSADKYLTTDSTFTMKVDNQNRKYEVTICLKTPPVISPVSESIFPYLATVYFEFAKFDKFYTYPADTSSLTKSENQNDRTKVDQLIQTVLDSLKKEENENKTLVLIGTADYIDIDNLETTRNLDYWSKKRSETVYHHLKKYKITNPIEIRFYGDYLKDYKIPSGLSDTLQRAYNRRVVISLLDQDVLDLIDKLSKEGKYKEIDEILANIREEVERLKKSKQINRP
ncbi:MAG: hypothetical protein NW226_23215 [Microscillaceae bacterium]|nr:hypothetical protein [Microscillaceae bacterium]